MSLSPQQYQQLMRFLDADMGEEEMLAFDKEMDDKPELRKQLEFEQSVRENFTQQKNFTAKIPTKKENAIVRKLPPWQNRKTWLAAAAIIITVSISISLLLVKNNATSLPIVKTEQTSSIKSNDSRVSNLQQDINSNVIAINTDSLFQINFAKEPPPDEVPLYLAQALEDYSQGNYKTLEQLSLNDLPETRGADNEKEKILLVGNFYKGVAALKQKKTLIAKKHFVWVINNAQINTWKEKAHWYFALASLQDGYKTEATTELTNLQYSPLYASRAKQLIKALR